MNNLKLLLYKCYLPSILARPCQRAIPIGKAAEKVNCFFIAMNKAGKPYLKFERLENQTIHCFEWNGQEYKTPKEIKINEINDDEIQITHYYGPNEISFDGIIDFAASRIFIWEYLKIYAYRTLDKWNQHFFNKKKLVSKRRIELLTLLVSTYANAKRGFDSVDLMTDLYSIKWLEHPEGDNRHTAIEFYLDSLVETGELKKVGSKYEVRPHALTTIEEYEELERKHTENVKVQRNMFWVSFAIAILALVQAGVIKMPTLIDLTKPNH